MTRITAVLSLAWIAASIGATSARAADEPWFAEMPAPAFVDHHGRVGLAKRSITEVNGGGVGLFDLDGDDDLDLFFAQGDRSEEHHV